MQYGFDFIYVDVFAAFCFHEYQLQEQITWTHHGLVRPYGDIDLDQLYFM